MDARKERCSAKERSKEGTKAAPGVMRMGSRREELEEVRVVQGDRVGA